MPRYKLFQVKSEFIREYGFCSLDQARKSAGGNDLPKAAWEEVYSFDKETAYIDAIDDLEGIYRTFNENRPEDFKGHSMSVSDIVEAPYGLWYCDSIGFKQVKWKEATEQ